MKKLIFPLLLLLSLPAFGQKFQGIHKGLISTQGTIAIGFDANKFNKEQRFYIYGEGEYLLSNHIGINGSAWANIGSSHRERFGLNGKLMEDAYVHSILAGPVFHVFSDQPFDLFFGVQPGFSFTMMKYTLPTDGVATDYMVSPTASVHGGVAVYASFFHLFAQVRYLRTQHFSIQEQQRLNDLRLCIGLGFNLNVLNLLKKGG